MTGAKARRPFWRRWLQRAPMTPAEGLVLVAAMTLVAAVLVEAPRGTITIRAGVILLTSAMLATVAALLHMVW